MKKALSLGLSLIMLFSALTVLPFSASAMYDDSSPKSEYEVKPPVGLTLVYNGKEQIGVLTGEDSNYVNYYGYDVINYKATNAGTYTATAVLWGDFGPQTFVWTDGTIADKKITFVIKKAPNTLNVKGKTAVLKLAKLKKKNQTLALKKAVSVSNAQGKASYKLVSAKKGNKSFIKKFAINSKTGKITVKKGTKKGTYKVKIKVSAAGNTNYEKASKMTTATIKVK